MEFSKHHKTMKKIKGIFCLTTSLLFAFIGVIIISSLFCNGASTVSSAYSYGKFTSLIIALVMTFCLAWEFFKKSNEYY